MNKFFIFLSMIIFSSISINTYSHSEHDKSRFVSPNGNDTGRCDNVLRPCASIGYAVKQANKGDKILVSAGQFSITTSDELFYLKSALVPVYGGYNRFDHFQSQSPQSNVTTIKNVPTEMASALRQKGFNVIADGKSFEKDSKLKEKLANYVELGKSQKDEVCTDGKASIFDCNNVDLLAHLPLLEMSSVPSSGSDIWGHVDLNTGREYAIMGLYNGVIIVDVTNPSNPSEVGTIDGVNSSWRDVKVYQYYDENINLWQAYAYATSEGSNSGAIDNVAIIDLNNLPNGVSLANKSTVVSTAHNVYISNVDYSLNIALPDQTPTLQLVGSSNRSGAFQSFYLDDPIELVKDSAKSYGNGYTHDGSSLLIDDERSLNNCGLSSGPCTVFIDFNEKEMKLWNITDPAKSTQLSSTEYNDVSKDNQYIHSGWGTEDQQYIFLHDEFDEYRGGLNSTVRIFSIEDLNNPVQVGQWTGPTRAIDHNGFVRGNRYYMSNYERGLTILDITDPANPADVGFFDTYTPSNNPSFNGAWGVYPFLPSGNILISDINSGLYILKDNSKASSTGQFTFNSKEISTDQGVTLLIDVQRNGTDISQATAVSYQVMQGSAEQSSDYTIENNTLNWASNDNEAKTISIDISEDTTSSEFPENFFIRLYNPVNGATLGQNSYATVNISGIADAGTGTFNLSEATVSENSGDYIVEVNRIGSSVGELTFDYQLTSNEAIVGTDVEEISGQISWADGESNTKEITLSIIDDEIEEGSETFNLSLSVVNNARIGTNGSITITIADDDSNVAPSITLGENFQVNTGQTVNLTAQASDTDGDEMSYLWEQTAGTSVVISDSTVLSTSFTAPNSAGTLTFDFTATDIKGLSTTASITITIVAQTEVITVTPDKSSGGGGSIAWFTLLCLILLVISRNQNRAKY